MKKYVQNLAVLLLALTLVFGACKKAEVQDDPPPPVNNEDPINYNAGLGNNPGYPVGMTYTLPNNIQIIGDIRGGVEGRTSDINKTEYKGPFPIAQNTRNWVTYGSGTFVNLYMLLYNSSTAPVNVAFPGGLIFCDTQDNGHEPQFQRGLVLQTVNISVPAQDTAWVHLPCYCLNASLGVPGFNTVYYIGPISTNPQLNQLVLLMAPKQYPLGNESQMQGIVWNITDHGQTLTPAEIQFINSLP
jgi:hypothetical protein